jgi:hypothetical protein
MSDSDKVLGYKAMALCIENGYEVLVGVDGVGSVWMFWEQDRRTFSSVGHGHGLCCGALDPMVEFYVREGKPRLGRKLSECGPTGAQQTGEWFMCYRMVGEPFGGEFLEVVVNVNGLGLLSFSGSGVSCGLGIPTRAFTDPCWYAYRTDARECFMEGLK